MSVTDASPAADALCAADVLISPYAAPPLCSRTSHLLDEPVLPTHILDIVVCKLPRQTTLLFAISLRFVWVLSKVIAKCENLWYLLVANVADVHVRVSHPVPVRLK